MKIAIGSDKSGYALKEAIKAYLASDEGKQFCAEKGAPVEVVDDLGTTDLADVHPYYRVAADVTPLVKGCKSAGTVPTYDRAILVCGTGAGMCVVANKYKGIQAVPCEGTYAARMARVINGAQILCMGGWIVAPEQGVDMAKTFLTTDYLEGAEEWRKTWLKNAAVKVDEIEERNFAD